MKLPKADISIKIAIIAVVSLLFSCESGKISVGRESGTEETVPDNRIWDMDITITDGNAIKAIVKAGVVERNYFTDHRYSVSRINSGLAIDFYDNGKVSGRLKSRKGSINDLSEVFTAVKDVVFTSLSGYTVYTDTLIWDRKKALIFTDTDVMMIRDGRDTLYGEGFRGDDRFESYEIKRPRGKAVID